jgi:hypothetical protein
METWVVILIIVVVLCSLSSLGLTLFMLQVEKSMEKDFGEAIAGLSADAARKKVEAKAKQDNIYYQKILIQDDATCPSDKNSGMETIVIEVKNGKATGVVNFCASEYMT